MEGHEELGTASVNIWASFSLYQSASHMGKFGGPRFVCHRSTENSHCFTMQWRTRWTGVSFIYTIMFICWFLG